MRKKQMSKKIRRPRLLLAAIIFMIVSAIILAQTIRSFTAENRSKAYENLPTLSKCIQEGGTIPGVQNPPKCCDGLVLGTDPLKVGLKGYSGTCMKTAADNCVREGGTIPVVQNPPKCCEGLLLNKTARLKGTSGTCVPRLKCNQACKTNDECQSGLICYHFQSVIDGVVNYERSYRVCRNPLNRSSRTCSVRTTNK